MTQTKAAKGTASKKQWKVPTEVIKRDVLVGKDILELLTTGMYVDALSIFREYIQNAADAIDEAINFGLINSVRDSHVQIELDEVDRRIKIRDNGLGIPGAEFEEKLTSLGASKKRGAGFRGFRGVGRLSGLGYCQTLTFRSKGPEDDFIRELVWDCRKLKRILRSTDFSGDLADVVRNVTSISTLKASKEDKAFFEVELDKVVRLKNDALLNEQEVKNYLCQVAPLPFRSDFSFGTEIDDFLEQYVPRRGFNILLGDRLEPLTRPFADTFFVTETKEERFEQIQFLKAESIDGSLSSVGWILHHGYIGAIRQQSELKGLRARTGDMQVGPDNVFEEIFPEPRFNSWVVGEVHILDRRMVPNGRRDNFEQNAHFYNLLNQLSPIGRDITKRCRNSSVARNALKSFHIEEQKVRERVQILKQGAISKSAARTLHKQIGSSLREMEQVANSDRVLPEARADLRKRISNIKQQARRLEKKISGKTPLDRLPPQKRRVYQEVLDLIYECSVNRLAAKAMVDRILARIEFLDH